MKRNPYLKVKIKSLAAEAKIIRAEELKFKKHGRGNDPYREGLYLHRMGLRREARLSLLVYQCLRGVPYAVCEKPKPEKVLKKADVERMAQMAKRFDVERQCDADYINRWVEGKVLVEKAA